ncbi:hypothetical protein Tco_1171074, partial [Tanacetum coccineum]
MEATGSKSSFDGGDEGESAGNGGGEGYCCESGCWRVTGFMVATWVMVVWVAGDGGVSVDFVMVVGKILKRNKDDKEKLR